MDAKTKLVFGEAYVEDVMTGKLAELARQRVGLADLVVIDPRMIANPTKRFGQHIINENKLTTVIYLSRIEDESKQVA